MSSIPDPTEPPATGADPDFVNGVAATLVASLDGIKEARDEAERRLLYPLAQNLDAVLASMEGTGRLLERIAADLGMPDPSG